MVWSGSVLISIRTKQSDDRISCAEPQIDPCVDFRAKGPPPYQRVASSIPKGLEQRLHFLLNLLRLGKRLGYFRSQQLAVPPPQPMHCNPHRGLAHPELA